VARALGFEAGHFQQQYAEQVRTGVDRALESNCVAQVLDRYIQERILPFAWQGTAGQLYELLNGQLMTDRASWPKSPKGLADQLRRIAPAYRAKASRSPTLATAARERFGALPQPAPRLNSDVRRHAAQRQPCISGRHPLWGAP